MIGIFCGLSAIPDAPDLSGVSLPLALLPILALIIFAAPWLLSIRFYEKGKSDSI
jgi:hypothetical protein